jgi:DNA mismatch repair protein MutL
MPKINLLDKQVAELIAAGEVVERPASVIKELVENAVDAGSTIITVEIRNGGISFMRVTDNGCGISREDVPTAFLRHATSKIKNEQDLDAIMTLGFRGEALAAISAVAQVELLTKMEDEEIGTRYASKGIDDFALEDAGCPNGTTIIIRELFFNTPVRMKFLKKDVTEGNAVAGILDKIALSHPEISFRFIRDGKQQLHTPGDGKLMSAIYAVFGKEFSKNLIPVDYKLNNIAVTGYISAPTSSRATRSMQNFFINNRFIKSRTAGAALDEAFKGSVMTGKFAACILNLEMSFEAVDVNVHPAKLEVRFVNEKPIFEVVYHAVKSALSAGDRPKVMNFVNSAKQEEKAEQLYINQTANAATVSAESSEQKSDMSEAEKVDFARTGNSSAVLKDSSPSTVRPNWPVESEINTIVDTHMPVPELTTIPKEAIPIILAPFAGNRKSNMNIDIFVTEEDDEMYADIKREKAETNPIKQTEQTDIFAGEVSLEKEHASAPDTPDIYSRYVGEVFGTYAIFQYGKDSLMLIDKHAAHERLLYEKLKAEIKGNEGQTLLEPVTVLLDKSEYSAVIQNKDMLFEAGFDVDDFGSGMVIVRSAPLILDGTDVKAAIQEIAGHLEALKTDITTEHLDWVYHNVACRAAIKGGDHSTAEELLALAKRLDENPEVRYCPHGRPIFLIMKKKDIEKQFGRIQ